MITDFQNAYVQLVADSRLRTRFLADPQAALAGFSLSGREMRALLAIPREQLARFASALIAKRAGEFRHALPLSMKISYSLEKRYRDWLASHPARRQETVLPPGLQEALRALPDLYPALARDEGEADYCADLFAFEVLSGCARIDGEARTMRARFRTDLIAAQIRRGVIPIDPRPAATEYYFQGRRLRWRAATTLAAGEVER